MKKYISGGIALFVIIVIAAMAIPRYNKFVVMDEKVNLSWSQVENQYQRRADLVPQLVSVVWEYASQEQETLESVVKARSEALSVKVDIDNVDELQQFYEKQWELTKALSKLMLLQESYPDLKSAPLFADLNVQLEWTENRISTERWRYNEEVNVFNSTVRQFPNNVFAMIFWVDTKVSFQSQEGSEIAPDVDELFER